MHDVGLHYLSDSKTIENINTWSGGVGLMVIVTLEMWRQPVSI